MTLKFRILCLCTFGLCSSTCGLLHRASVDPNERLGQDIGETLREAGAQTAADASHNNGGHSAFQESMLHQLSSDQDVLVNPKVSEVIAETNNIAAHQTVPSDNVCRRNWAQPCPDGWSRLGENCLAPPSYEYFGGCRNLQSFTGASVMAKYRFASDCKAPWPCEDHCSSGHDYETCPQGWIDVGAGFCKRQNSDGKCKSMYKFDDMSIGDKQELAAVCDVKWTCATKCVEDYSKACPQGWSELSGLCIAPPTYAGECVYSVNTTGMTELQKKHFAAKCSVEFPCSGTSLLRHEERWSPKSVSFLSSRKLPVDGYQIRNSLYLTVN